ncbi:MAG: hypothetical protein WCU00_00795 [Candidatus Latescibacterota bacterium]
MFGMDITHLVMLILFVAILLLFAFNCSIHKDNEDKEGKNKETE